MLKFYVNINNFVKKLEKNESTQISNITLPQRTQSIKKQQISTCALCAFFVYFALENTFWSMLKIKKIKKNKKICNFFQNIS